MKEWLIFVTENAVILINGVALLTVIAGTIEACLNGLRLMFSSSSANLMRETWVRFGRWLIAALTFQLAADIIGTAIAPSWQEIGKLGAIAVIRTFLDFFLERDLADVRSADAQPVSPGRLWQRNSN